MASNERMASPVEQVTVWWRYAFAATVARTADAGAAVGVVLLAAGGAGGVRLGGLLAAALTAPHLLGATDRTARRPGPRSPAPPRRGLRRLRRGARRGDRCAPARPARGRRWCAGGRGRLRTAAHRRVQFADRGPRRLPGAGPRDRHAHVRRVGRRRTGGGGRAGRADLARGEPAHVGGCDAGGRARHAAAAARPSACGRACSRRWERAARRSPGCRRPRCRSLRIDSRRRERARRADALGVEPSRPARPAADARCC